MTLILIIEVLQVLTMRGWFELSDIVDNTIGIVFGYCVYYLGRKIWEKLKH